MFLTSGVLCLLMCVAIVISAPVYECENIIGGTIADNIVKYQASLRHCDTGEHFCAGSIISDTWILTAAHCVCGKSESSIITVVGTKYLNRGGKRYKVKEIISHEDYDEETSQNDIAVLQVYGRIRNFLCTVASVRLSDTRTPGRVKAEVFGWGATVFPPETLSNTLQRISLTTMPISECQKDLKYESPVFDTNICTYGRSGNGMCNGDSGGPLVAKGKQIGIVSWGMDCAIGYPDVYASVSAFRRWIYAKTGV